MTQWVVKWIERGRHEEPQEFVYDFGQHMEAESLYSKKLNEDSVAAAYLIKRVTTDAVICYTER